MRRALALALVALLLAPAARGQGSDPEYPADMLALLPAWIEQAEARAREGDEAREWWPEAASYLARAKEAQAEGRLRLAMFHLETFTEILAVNHLMASLADRTSDAERRAAIVQETAAWRADAEAAWGAFRAQLHEYDGQLRSLQTIEQALYAADLAAGAAVGMDDHGRVAREFPRQPGVPMGYVYALVRASSTAHLNILWAQDLLSAAVRGEGLPPRVEEEPWTNLTHAVVQPRDAETPVFLEMLEARAQPAREGNESLLALTFLLAEQRATRVNGMQSIFGDAQSRGLSVVADATRGMSRQLNNTTHELPRSYGLFGVFTSDAIDRARLTLEHARAANTTLGVVLAAWGALEHQLYVIDMLGAVSPVQPEPQGKERTTPAPSLALLVVAAGALALVRRARR